MCVLQILKVVTERSLDTPPKLLDGLNRESKGEQRKEKELGPFPSS